MEDGGWMIGGLPSLPETPVEISLSELRRFNKAIALLKKFEWCNRGRCPSCNGVKPPGKGHADDCELKRVIE